MRRRWHDACSTPFVLNVLLVDDAPDRSSALKEALGAMEGVRVTCTLSPAMELPRQVAEVAPDIVLIETESPSRDVLEQLAVMSSTAPRPVILFTEDGGNDAIRAALKAGVSAYIVDGVSRERLDPIIRVAMERFDSEQQLRAELNDVKLRLAERKVVERAKGILMQQRGFSEDEAFKALRTLAMQRNLRLGEAAQQLIDIAGLLG
jgi:response regulator NasT